MSESSYAPPVKNTRAVQQNDVDLAVCQYNIWESTNERVVWIMRNETKFKKI